MHSIVSGSAFILDRYYILDYAYECFNELSTSMYLLNFNFRK